MRLFHNGSEMLGHVLDIELLAFQDPKLPGERAGLALVCQLGGREHRPPATEVQGQILPVLASWRRMWIHDKGPDSWSAGGLELELCLLCYLAAVS